ncbi:MAG: LytTR family transcriptional regulator [Clostridiales bacterium]|uniref:LytTR family DNA-binding domain-containing protein n=1 Tax=Clostridium sp. N3C TaxID=1776758 RepID=UPI00092DFC55|nr:LytTR family DNA-binding domain-containing protein [Clostridium sp. N3C]NLZ49108.1 LytTR family transcriptional regulator [Clostridiales bacterium]SCN26362.1 putative HTH-type transcriptional regulator [Clostridium sp. N3C]
MKITIDECPSHKEVEIVIKCDKVTEEVEKVISLLRSSEEKITGVIEGERYLIDPSDIYYFESVDKKTFMYTESQVLEIPLRLYELEEKLAKQDFFRASKSTIINISKIQRLSPRLNGKLDVILENNEKLVVSRQYVGRLKDILGL